MRLVFLLLIGLLGCKQVISHKVISTSAPYQTNISCSYAGFCFGYNYGAGSGSWGFGFHPNCQGQQLVIAHDVITRYNYDDGTIQDFNSRKIDERLGSCK